MCQLDWTARERAAVLPVEDGEETTRRHLGALICRHARVAGGFDLTRFLEAILRNFSPDLRDVV
jgi:hypothetical protein